MDELQPAAEDVPDQLLTQMQAQTGAAAAARRGEKRVPDAFASPFGNAAAVISYGERHLISGPVRGDGDRAG